MRASTTRTRHKAVTPAASPALWILQTMTTVYGLLILLASIIGHTEYWVLLVNRLHSFRINHRFLKTSRRLHDFAIIGYVILVTGYAVVAEHGLLRGGTFSVQPGWMQWLLLIMLPGLIPWSLGILRWHWTQKHSFHATDHRSKMNLLAQTSTAAEKRHVVGPRRHVSRWFPWNEVFQLEINQKSIRLGSHTDQRRDTPTSLLQTQPIRVVHLSDLHFVGCPGEQYYRRLFEQAAALKPDAFAFTGDLIDDLELLPLARELFSQLPPIAPCFFILGNHDWRYDFAQIRAEIAGAGWNDVSAAPSHVQLAGHSVIVCGNELPWLGTAPPDVSGSNAALRLLLSHSPDQMQLARRQGFDVMLAGHTHGGQVVLPLIGPVYAPSRYGVRFASGLFEVDGLHLHVSRGVGGKDPLRWRCTPELTCVHIHLPTPSTASNGNGTA